MYCEQARLLQREGLGILFVICHEINPECRRKKKELKTNE